MFEKRFDEKTIVSAVLGTWVGFSILASYALFVENNTNVYAENGILETLQAVLLGLSCILFLATAAWEKGAGRLVILFCSLLCYGFVLREVDVETFDIPDLLIQLGSGAGRNATLAAGLLVLCLTALFAGLREQFRLGLDFARSRSGLLLLTGLGFLLLGDVFEKELLGSFQHHVFFEEMSELLGDLMILLSAVTAGIFLNQGAESPALETRHRQ
ncbi:MAG TPA: hypothetical protein VL178_04710 [Pseudomonas sp.]|nr:hypothetical protein [Pseudomonas sp.]